MVCNADLYLLSKLKSEEIIKIEIPNVGVVAFPENMEMDEIKKIIRSNYDTSPEKILKIADDLMHKRNQDVAEEARIANNKVREENRKIFIYSFLSWIGTICGLYVAGWSIGWIWRGFKST